MKNFPAGNVHAASRRFHHVFPRFHFHPENTAAAPLRFGFRFRSVLYATHTSPPPSAFPPIFRDFSKNEKHDSSIPSIKIQIKDNSYHEASSTSFLTRLSYEIHSHNNLNHSHLNYPQNFQSSFIDFVSFNSLLKIPRHKTKNHKQKLNQMRKYLLDNSF